MVVTIKQNSSIYLSPLFPLLCANIIHATLLFSSSKQEFSTKKNVMKKINIHALSLHLNNNPLLGHSKQPSLSSMDKSGHGVFSRIGNGTGCESENNEEPSSGSVSSLREALKDVNKFLETLSSASDKAQVPEFPTCIESLLKRTETMINEYDSRIKFGKHYSDDSVFVESLVTISKLMNVLGEFNCDSNSCPYLNQASAVVHAAMSLLGSEFRAILQSCSSYNSDKKSPKPSKQSSFGSQHGEPEKSMEDEDCPFPGYLPEAVSAMCRIATAMILLGYENECCMVYNTIRRNAFNSELDKIGYENLSIEDVQRMQWESLENEVSTWINTVKHSFSVLLSEECKLCNCVFSEFPSISQRLFSNLALAVLEKFLGFADAVALTKKSSEKLFKVLDIYETLQDLVPAIDQMGSSERAKEIKKGTLAVKDRLGQIAVTIFCDIEGSIKRDHSKSPVPSGAVHPLTRQIMKYIKHASEYQDTLEQVFQQQYYQESSSRNNNESTPNKSPFAEALSAIMELLDENLEAKSKLYRDLSLRYIFLMNNGRYILQKIKAANEISEVLGATWCRKRTSDLRTYHKGYTRETWTKIMQSLSHEGLQANGKVPKPVLKERFKTFNSSLDEIQKTQSTWVVSDEQLQSELRVSISAMVIPAYRSFLGRFQQYFTPGRQTEKYVKYQPEDVENLIDGLFDGNATSMARKKT